MLAVTWPEPFSDPRWRFELKWDGVRALLSADDGVGLRSRRGNDLSAAYPELSSFVPGRRLILDGEIVALGDDGMPSFQRLQGRMNLTGEARIAEAARRSPVQFVVFDVLFDGEPVITEPWARRRERLDHIALEAPFVRSEVQDEAGPIWSFVRERGIEGIMAKRVDARYEPGVRSSAWRKIPAYREVRAVVGGFTSGEGGRRGTFGSLLVGLWEGERLRYVGSVGSGFDDRALRAITAALDEMRVDETPFASGDGLPQGAVWVEPRLVAAVQFREWTSAGRLRAPSFKGFTDDPRDEATWEREGPLSS